jgi:hypothetical protein
MLDRVLILVIIHDNHKMYRLCLDVCVGAYGIIGGNTMVFLSI